MTLENCKLRLKQYENIIDGTVKKPFGHKNWNQVIKNAEEAAEVMRERIKWKSSDAFKQQQKDRGNPRFADFKPQAKKEEKTDAKK